MSSFSPITTLPSLAKEAQRAIRAGIITGEIKPGVIYSVPSLAARLGVSATPVREALLDLMGEGLVESVRNRGFRVVVLDDSDLDEIFELRMLVEIPSVAKAAGRFTDEQTENLYNHLDALERAAESGDLLGYLTADRAFHLGLLAPLGNERLVDLVGRLRDQQRLYGLPRMIHSASFMETSSEHREILSAAVSGESNRAGSLMGQHLRHTRGVWAGLQEGD